MVVELIFQVLQLPIILIISIACFVARYTLTTKEVVWVGIGFLINFFYIVATIFSNNIFTLELPISFSTLVIKCISGPIKLILDDCTYILFFIPLYHYAIEKIWNINTRLNGKFFWKQIFIIIPLILLLIVSIYQNLIRNDSTYQTNFAVVTFKAACLFFLFFFFKNITGQAIHNIPFLLVGFFTWAALQFLQIGLPDNLPILVVQRIGFGTSLLAKILILIGIGRIAIEFEKKKTKEIVEAKTREEEYEKSSKSFEGILRNTFHEITIPLKTLGDDIGLISKYVNRDHRSQYKDLEFHYQRVKAIIAVAKSSYRPEIVDLDPDNFEIDRDSTVPLNINYLLEKSAKAIKSTYGDVGFEYSYGKNVLISGNQTELLQIFINLIKNSLEAYNRVKESEEKEGKNRKIILHSYNLRSKANIDPLVVVEIEDYATGIDEEIKDKIWNRGFTIKGKNDRSTIKGEGLFIVKQLCEKNEITIDFQSPVKLLNQESHTGTKFILTFKKKKNRS